MSYVVLARKYRPPNFEALVGQEHVVQALSNALTQQRLHHAYLFTGTRGVGKTTVSRILAKSLNCTGVDGTGGITAHPCGVCAACRDIDAGRFIDYVELDAASNRGVDEISQLLDQAVYKPVVGRFKVYMIDEVHMLSNTAFNAMLKTLEEPPDYLKFVLATTDPQKIPPTVLSRCLQFNLRPMAPQTVQTHLATVLAEEHIAADVGALRLLARAARGSMRDALSLTDQAIAFGAGTLAEAGVREMLGAVDRGHAVRVVEALVASDGAGLVVVADALRSLGLSATGTLEELAGLLQQMAVLQAVPDAADADDPDAPQALRLSALLAPDETQLLYSIALHGRAELALSSDEYSGLVMVLLRMLTFRPEQALQTGSGSTSSQAGALAARPAAAAGPPAVPAKRVEAQVPVSTSRSMSTPAETAASAALATPVVKPPPRTAALDEPPPWLDVPFDDTTAAPAFDDATSALDRAVLVRESSAADPVSAASPVSGAPARAATTVTAVAERALIAPAQADEAVISKAAVGKAGISTAVIDKAAAVVSPLVVASLAPPASGDRWAGLVRELVDAGSIGALVRELAMQAHCTAIDESADPVVCTLHVEREMLRAQPHCEKLQAALAGWLGRPVRLQVDAGAAADSPAKRDAAERIRRQTEAERIIHDDPLVRELMARYETARIVPGSVRPH